MNKRDLLAGLIAPIASAVKEGSGKDEKDSAPGPRAGYFPNYILHTHENKEVRFYDDLIKGKIVVINMFYAECGGI